MNTESRVALVAQAAIPIFDEVFTKACCLNGTRCFIEALRTFDVKARPVSVNAIAANRVWVERLKAGLRPLDDPNAWAIGVETKEADDGNWAGHLVALVDGCVLVDTAAGQMNRPAHDILVPSFFAAEWNGKKTRQYDLPEGGVIEYAPRKYDTSYLKMPGYSLHVENQEIVARIVQAVEQEKNVDGR